MAASDVRNVRRQDCRPRQTRRQYCRQAAERGPSSPFAEGAIQCSPATPRLAPKCRAARRRRRARSGVLSRSSEEARDDRGSPHRRSETMVVRSLLLVRPEALGGRQTAGTAGAFTPRPGKARSLGPIPVAQQHAPHHHARERCSSSACASCGGASGGRPRPSSAPRKRASLRQTGDLSEVESCRGESGRPSSPGGGCAVGKYLRPRRNSGRRKPADTDVGRRHKCRRMSVRRHRRRRVVRRTPSPMRASDDSTGALGSVLQRLPNRPQLPALRRFFRFLDTLKSTVLPSAIFMFFLQ